MEQILEFPKGSNLPYKVQKSLKIRGPQIVGMLTTISTDTNIKVIPCCSPEIAEKVALSIMRKVYKRKMDGL
jgi:hypothetical protein